MSNDKPIVIERQEFDSKSEPGKYYETVVRSDGLVACNCRGWTMKKNGKPRRCAHTDKVIGRRETVDDGTYIYIAKLADRVVKYRAAKAAQERQRPTQPPARPVKADPNMCPECGGIASHWGNCSRGVKPPPVVPPVLSPPGRRRIVFTDD